MNPFERLFKLWAMICKMIMDGVRDAEEVANILQGIVDGPANVAKKVVRRLRLTRMLFGGVVLSATTGREVETAKAVFDGYCDPAFLEGAENEQPEGECALDVEEIMVDGKYRQIFGGFGRDLDELAMSRSRITAFCRDHRDKLRGGGYGTFLLFKRQKFFFVAGVYVDDGGQLNVSVDPLSHDDVWYAEFQLRIVVPQSLGSPSA
ncbi:hypothetical protein HYW73_00040 [Candidatus Nomurabacteria bacterium]|nr:hypothetical protein [Candidatus Nomurabacteria bacterium]